MHTLDAPLLHPQRSNFVLAIHPGVVLFGRRFHSFRVCGVAGILLATGVTAALIAATGLSFAVGAVLLASGLATFVVLALATKVVTGSETLIYYHHEIAILLVAAGVLTLSGRAALPYLDLNALWLGIFLSCGRAGCLMVGCCHGRPHHWGVRYTEAHAAEGFPPVYVGVRLFPVQALESVVVIGIVVAGVVQLLQGRPAGTVLSTYVVTYAAARIGLEELRGDAARPSWRGFSEGQWTSLALVASVLLGEWQGRLPMSRWHAGIGVAAALAMLCLALARPRAREALQPRHAHEVAEIVRLPETPTRVPRVHRTSRTIGISMQTMVGQPSAPTTLYCLSRADRAMTPSEARAMAGLIANVAGPGGRAELLRGRPGIFHLIIRGVRP